MSETASGPPSAPKSRKRKFKSAIDAVTFTQRCAQAAASVQWGPWGEVGMAAGGAVNARLKASGWRLITPAQGLMALQAALATGAPAVMAMAARWL